MKKMLCNLLGHRFIPHDEAALLRALAWSDTEFCDRCGFNTLPVVNKGGL